MKTLLRTFSANSLNSRDPGTANWLAMSTGVTSSAQYSMQAHTSYMFAKGASFVSVPISTRGRGGVVATSIEVSFFTILPLANPLPVVQVALSFDGGAPVVQSGSVTGDMYWAMNGYKFAVPASSNAFTMTLTYVGDASGMPCFFDAVAVRVYADGDPSGFLRRNYDQVCWLCAHNAFANSADGWYVWAQQSVTVSRQLADGVRAFMLDIALDDGDIRLLHNGWIVSNLLRPGISDFRRLSETLSEINTFLDANPTEVVTIYFESDVNTAAGYALITQAFQNAGTPQDNLAQKLFRYDRRNTGRGGATWDVATQGAPILQWMVDNNLRCVVFTSCRIGDPSSSNRASVDGLAMAWHFTRETVYSDPSTAPATWTDERGESLAASANTRTLNLVNHFPSWAVGMILPAGLSYRDLNDSKNIGRHVNAYAARYNALPNFIAVDYYGTGDNGGPLMANQRVNLSWAGGHVDPPQLGPVYHVGKNVDVVKQDLIASSGCDSLVAISLINASNIDLKVLRGYAKHGKIVDDFPQNAPGLESDVLLAGNFDASILCAGVSTVSMGMYGPQCFWLLQAPEYPDFVLFVAVSSPFALMFYNNYANAYWVKRDTQIDAFITNGAGGDDMFDRFYRESNNDTSAYALPRLRSRPWICSTWDMANRTPGDMTVWVWSY